MKVVLESNTLENKVINSAYNCFKNDIKRQPSVITEENQVINEGLKFFKASPRLYKLALKIERKAQRNQELGLGEIVKKINALANKFEYVEDLYEVGRKAEAKTQYKDLCKKYNDVLKMLRKNDVKNSLKKIGGLAFTVASMTIPYIAMSHFFPSLALTQVNSEAANMSFYEKTGLYLKRAGAFTLCGIPVKLLRSGFQFGTDAMEQKAIVKVDKLLDSTDVDYSKYDDDELHQL